MAIEHQLAGRPDVDEIDRDAQALVVEYPPMGEERRRKKRCVDDEQHEAAFSSVAGITLGSGAVGADTGVAMRGPFARRACGRAPLPPIRQTALKKS